LNNWDKLYVSTWEFNPSEYLKLYKLQKIGQGGYGIVYKGKHEITDEEVAVKVISRFNIQGASSSNQLYQEAKVL